MSISNSELNYLFKEAQNEKPVASFEETQKAFLTATVVAAGGVLATKGLLKLLTLKKWILMFSIISIATTGAVVVALTSGPTEPVENAQEPIYNVISEESPEIMPEEENIIAYESVEPEIESLEEPILTVDDTSDNEPPAPEDTMEVIAPLAPGNGTGVYVATGTGSGTSFVLAPSETIKPYDMRFRITKSTTKEQLEEIKREAIASGIQFDYDAKFNGEELEKINLKMNLKRKDGRNSDIAISNISLNGDIDYNISWNVDDNGQATEISCGEDVAFIDDIEGIWQDVFAEYDWQMDNLYAQLDSAFTGVQWEEFEEQFENFEDEIRWREETLEEALEKLRHEDVQEMLDEVTGASQEIIRQLEEELEIMRERIEETEEEEEKERDNVDRQRQNMTKKSWGLAPKNNCGKEHKILKEELIKDGLIKEKAKRIKMEANYKTIKVDGKKIPKGLYPKYRELLRDLFALDIERRGTSWAWTSECK